MWRHWCLCTRRILLTCLNGFSPRWEQPRFVSSAGERAEFPAFNTSVLTINRRRPLIDSWAVSGYYQSKQARRPLDECLTSTCRSLHVVAVKASWRLEIGWKTKVHALRVVSKDPLAQTAAYLAIVVEPTLFGYLRPRLDQPSKIVNSKGILVTQI